MAAPVWRPNYFGLLVFPADNLHTSHLLTRLRPSSWKNREEPGVLEHETGPGGECL